MVVLVVLVGAGIAGTQDKTIGGTSGYPGNVKGNVFLFERTIDFSLAANTGTSNDLYQLLNIPANSFVLKVGYMLEENADGYTGENGTCTIDVGDGDDADGYFDGSNVETGQTASAMTIWSPATVAATMVTGVTAETYSLSVSTGQPTLTTFAFNAYDGAATNTYTAVSNVVNNVLTVPVGTNVTVTSETVYPVKTAPVGYAQGKLYTSADTLDMLLNNDADELKITVRALVIPVGGL